jgi:tetratricopeptide (TPR) repeat protein
MRGNGKSSVIDALIGQEPWTSWDPEIRIVASVVREPSDFFRWVAKALGISDECPQPPTGTLQEQIEALSRRVGRLRRTVVWVDQAHLWFDRDNWRNAQLGVLVAALQRVVGDQWGWIFELRERPPQGLFPKGTAVEVTGLDKDSLREWLANSAPDTDNTDWQISGNDLRAMYQWLGGGQGHQAHPFATRLLIDVALGLGVSPMEVRQRFLKQAEDQVEQFLLADLFNHVLSDSEQKLLLALSLYRGAIPHDHIEPLEARLTVANAWTGLDQRCLLPADSRQERFYLHGFLSAWLRQKLGYQSEDGSDADVTAHEEVAHHLAKELHQAIGECWLEQVRGRRHVTAVNIERALEAFHHLIAAGELWSVREIAIDLIAGHHDGALDRLWTICSRLHKEKKGDDHLERVLRYILQISPDDPKALRYLGETLRRVRGRNDAEALACFQRAFEVQPSFAPNLANLGVSLLAQGAEGASEYLRVVDLARKQNPTAVNHYVVAVELDCLDLVSPDPEAASRKRLELINAGSRHAAFYGTEASWQLEHGDPAEALRILELADERRCGDEVTASIKATALEKLGRGADASRLRQAMIDRGTRSPAIYSAEIAHLIGQNKLNRAKRLVEQADKRGCGNEYIASARAHVLGEMGQGAEASRYRMKLIDGNSRDAAIYHDEAKLQLEQGNPGEAARLLDCVDEFGGSNEYTLTIRASVLEVTGKGPEASKLRTEKINANSRNPAFYTAEAKWLLDMGLTENALQILDVLDERGLGNEFANGLRASALHKAGRNEEASRIRQRMINRGSKYLPVFIAEAEWQLAQSNFDEVIRIAGLAKQRGIENAQLATLLDRASEVKSRQ